MREEHERRLYSSPEQLLHHVRQRYWPINGRRLAQKTVKTCLRCFRYRPVIPEVLSWAIYQRNALLCSPDHLRWPGWTMLGPFNFEKANDEAEYRYIRDISLYLSALVQRLYTVMPECPREQRATVAEGMTRADVNCVPWEPEPRLVSDSRGGQRCSFLSPSHFPQSATRQCFSFSLPLVSRFI